MTAMSLLDNLLKDTDKKISNPRLEDIVEVKDPDRFQVTMDCSSHCNCGGSTHCKV